MWYGKGPGVDRIGDALHCANMGGTHKHGGVLAIAGDDHGAHSSTYPHQTEYVFQNCFIPVLNPASVQDVHRPRAGRLGDVAVLRRLGGDEDHGRDDGAGVHRHRPVGAPVRRRPTSHLPPHGLNFDHTMHFPADRAELERRMIEERMPAVLAWARANRHRPADQRRRRRHHRAGDRRQGA